MKYVKRALSWVLVLAMVAGLVPASAFATEQTYSPILLDQEITLSTDVNGGEGIFQFIPEEDGIYRFYSYNNTLDILGYILDEDLNILRSDDDGGDGNNFSAEYSMTAGRVYHLMAKPYSEDNVGSYCVSVIKLVKATGFDISQDTVFDHAGEGAALSVEFFPENGAAEEITWTSADPTIATVYDGWVEMISAGTTVITATTASGMTDSVTVTVRGVPYITAGQEVTMPTPEGYHNAVMKFVPEQTGVYRFYSFNSADGANPYGFMKDIHLNEFAYNQDSKGVEFAIECTLNAGETYYLFAENCGTYSAPYSVCIIPLVPATGMEIVEEAISGYPTEQQSLSLRFLPDNGMAEAVTWTSDNPEIATVDENGIVTFLAVGSATITATTAGGLTDSVTATVKDYEKIELGQQIKLTTDAGGGVGFFGFTPEESGVYRWYSFDNGGNDCLDTYGHLLDDKMQELDTDDDGGGNRNFCIEYPMTAGETYYLKARPYSSDGVGSYSVEVKKLTAATAMKIVLEDAVGYVGEQLYLGLEFAPEDSAAEEVTWVSGNPKVAKVDKYGDVQLVSAGSTTITATSVNGLTDSVTVTVKDVPDIALDQEMVLDAAVDQGKGMFRFIPTEDGVYRFYSYNSTLDSFAYLLDENKNQIGYDDDSGEEANFLMEYSLTAGQTYYLSTRPYSGDRKGQYSVKIIKLVPATALNILRDEFSGYPGDTCMLVTEFHPDNAFGEEVSWSSSDPNVVTVDADGMIRLVAVGTATVTATSENGLTDSITVTVKTYPAIQAGVPAQAEIQEVGQDAWFVFTPQEDGYYAFYSISDTDTCGAIYDPDGNELAYNDDSNLGRDFKVKYHLEAGKNYRLKAECYGDRTGTFQVCVEQVAYITKLEVMGLPEMNRYVENHIGDIRPKGLRLQATWSDGTVSDWLCLSDRYMEDIKDERVELDASEAEKTGKVIVSCGGQTASFAIEIVEDPVDHLELVEGSVFGYIEGYGGYLEGDQYIYYTDYPYDAQIRIVYKSGASKIAHVGEKVDGYPVDWEHHQQEKPWQVGTDNASTVSYLGHTVNLPITVKENKVAKVEVLSGSVTCIENGYGDQTGSSHYHYYYNLPQDVTVKITYTDGTSKTVNAYDKVDGYDILIDDRQYDEPWTVGGENYIYVSYLGVEGKMPAYVIPATLERLELRTAPTKQYIYGDLAYGYAYGNEYEFYPRDLTGLSFTAYYKDGTSRVFTYQDMDMDAGEINGYPFEISMKEWVVQPGTHTVTLSYMGKSVTYPVDLKESSVASIEVIKAPAKNSYSSYFAPDFTGMEILITNKDNTTQVVKLTEQNVLCEYEIATGMMYKVDVNGYDMVIMLDGVGSARVYYLGKTCRVTGLQSADKRWVSKVELDGVNPEGDRLVVNLTYSDGATESLPVEKVFVSYEDDMVMSGYGKTKYGYMYYTIRTYRDEKERPVVYLVSIFDEEVIVAAPDTLPGDVNNDGLITDADAMYLLRHTLFPSRYPVEQAVDYTGDGQVTDADAMYLLRHTLFPSRYPLN